LNSQLVPSFFVFEEPNTEKHGHLAIWPFEATTFQNDWMMVVFPSELDGKKRTPPRFCCSSATFQ